MIRKFATISGGRIAQSAVLIAILAGVATVHAQQTSPDPQTASPSQAQPQQTQPQQPAQTQQPQGEQEQEATPEESVPIHRVKPKLYKNWVYNVGAGANLTSGTTKTYVRSGGLVGAAGAARNFNQYFGLRLDFQFDDLPLRASALQLASSTGGNSHVYALNFGPVINLPFTKTWGAYIVGGVGFYRRAGKLDNSQAIAGSTCNGFFLWWGHCFNGSLPVSGQFLHSSENAFGEEVGAGVTRKIGTDWEIYAEIRHFHGSHGGVTTDLSPITIGVRW
jgi:hypothetical protein